MIRFFVRGGGRPGGADTAFAHDLTLAIWRPRERFPTPLDPLRLATWLQDRCGLFDDGRYTELSLWRGEQRVHRLVVTPRWYRFPFMNSGDLQIGALWTDPAWRRRGLARRTMAEAHRLFAGPSQRFWYVTDAANAASTALALAAGYQPCGEGRRTRPIGIGPLGQFRLDRPGDPRAPIPG